MPGYPSRLRGTGVAYIQAFLTMLVGLYSLGAGLDDLPIHLFQLPAGFQISLYASVADARY